MYQHTRILFKQALTAAFTFNVISILVRENNYKRATTVQYSIFATLWTLVLLYKMYRYSYCELFPNRFCTLLAIGHLSPDPICHTRAQKYLYFIHSDHRRIFTLTFIRPSQMDPEGYVSYKSSSTVLGEGVYQFIRGGMYGAIWGMITPFPAPGTAAALAGMSTYCLSDVISLGDEY